MTMIRKWLGWTAIALLAAVIAHSAMADDHESCHSFADYSFIQEGFANQSTTASVCGLFSGSDTNFDGFLTSDELSEFSFSIFLSDGSFLIASGVNLLAVEGGGFSFRTDDSILGNDAGEFISAEVSLQSVGTFAYSSGNSGGEIRYPQRLGIFTSDELIAVTPIPEPGTHALLLAGLTLTGLAVRRRRTVEALRRFGLRLQPAWPRQGCAKYAGV